MALMIGTMIGIEVELIVWGYILITGIRRFKINLIWKNKL